MNGEIYAGRSSAPFDLGTRELAAEGTSGLADWGGRIPIWIGVFMTEGARDED